MSRAEIWAEVKEMFEKGERPVIRIPKAARVIERRPPGRPRLKPVGSSLHYRWLLQTPSGRAMRCRNRGCDRTLRQGSSTIVCGPACEVELRRQCEITLAVLNKEIPVTDFPPDLRGWKTIKKLSSLAS